MAYLGYGLAQGEGFIVVTGEIGAQVDPGRHLMASIDRERLNAISSSHPGRRRRHVRLVAQGSASTPTRWRRHGCSTRSSSAGEDLGAGRDIADRRRGAEPARVCSKSCACSNFQVSGRALIQTILLGQPEFRDKPQVPDWSNCASG
jgi:hypothetical protein